MKVGEDPHPLFVLVLVDGVSWGFGEGKSAESEDESTDTLDRQGDSPCGV